MPKTTSRQTRPAPRRAAPIRTTTVVLAFIAIVLSLVLLRILLVGPGRYYPVVGIHRTNLSTSELIYKVSHHILVNANETPTIATVQDPDMLRDRDPIFYKDAQVGDRLLIYSDKAILYSEARDLILAVLPAYVAQRSTQPPTNTTTSTSSATTTSQIPQEMAKIEVRNGTRTAGLARILADKLKALGLDVITSRDANVKNYQNTIISVMSDKPFPNTVKVLSDLLHAPIVPLPASEKNVKGDIVIIIGADYQP
jgi:hypothetical protein